MKIINWNCNGAFRKKIEVIDKLNADILIIQECEDPGQCTDTSYKLWAKNYLWSGNNKNKGLGIFTRPEIELTKLDWDSDNLKHFLPCRVNKDFNLLATWCHGANSPTFGYIGQLWKYMQLHKDKFEKIMIAGDFNSNAIWDKCDRWWNHSDVVRELKEIKINSAYHKLNSEEQGKESIPTLYLQRNLKKSYHIDYIFAHDLIMRKIQNLSIGSPKDWLVWSDHMPVICELK